MWATLAAAPVAILLDDDAALPVTVGTKTIADLRTALDGHCELISAEEVTDALGPTVPDCGEDGACWQDVAAQLGVARVLVLSLHSTEEHALATIWIVDRWGDIGRGETKLPQGGGFPLKLIDWLVEHPPPAEPETERPGWLARLFRR